MKAAVAATLAAQAQIEKGVVIKLSRIDVYIKHKRAVIFMQVHDFHWDVGRASKKRTLLILIMYFIDILHNDRPNTAWLKSFYSALLAFYLPELPVKRAKRWRDGESLNWLQLPNA